MADFKQAYEWMRDGKKVKMESWADGTKPLYMENGNVRDEINLYESLYISWFMADNWIIVSKDQSLSTKMHTIKCTQNGFTYDNIVQENCMTTYTNYIDSEDLKDTIERLIDKWKVAGYTNYTLLHRELKEFFGKKLVKGDK